MKNLLVKKVLREPVMDEESYRLTATQEFSSDEHQNRLRFIKLQLLLLIVILTLTHTLHLSLMELETPTLELLYTVANLFHPLWLTQGLYQEQLHLIPPRFPLQVVVITQLQCLDFSMAIIPTYITMVLCHIILPYLICVSHKMESTIFPCIRYV